MLVTLGCLKLFYIVFRLFQFALRLFEIDGIISVKTESWISLGCCRFRDVVQVVLGAADVEVAQLYFWLFAGVSAAEESVGLVRCCTLVCCGVWSVSYPQPPLVRARVYCGYRPGPTRVTLLIQARWWERQSASSCLHSLCFCWCCCTHGRAWWWWFCGVTLSVFPHFS